jgi:hypothetical protein
MRGTASLNANQARRQLGEKRQHLRAPQCLPDADRARGVNAMHLKNMFGQIQADGGNLHTGGSFARVCVTATAVWHLDAVSGSHPPHLLSGTIGPTSNAQNEAQSGHFS